MDKDRKTTSLKMNQEIWKEVRIHCIREDIEVSDYIEYLVKKDLKLTKE